MNNNIEFTGNYLSYNEFYDDNKTIIYKKITDTFEYMNENNVEKYVLNINANINNFFWSTDIVFHNKDKQMLEDHILKYFEENEEYEYCQKVKQICSI
jgi:hypothetical protein